MLAQDVYADSACIRTNRLVGVTRCQHSMSRQPALSSFGFRRHVTFRGNLVPVADDVADDCRCRTCGKKCASRGSLATHRRWLHEVGTEAKKSAVVAVSTMTPFAAAVGTARLTSSGLGAEMGSVAVVSDGSEAVGDTPVGEPLGSAAFGATASAAVTDESAKSSKMEGRRGAEKRARRSVEEKKNLWMEWQSMKHSHSFEEAAEELGVPASTFWKAMQAGGKGYLSEPGNPSRKVIDSTAWSRSLPFRVKLRQLEEGTMQRLVKARRHRQQLMRKEIVWHAKRFAKKTGLLWRSWTWHNKRPFKLCISWAKAFVEKKSLRMVKPRGRSNASSAKEKQALQRFHSRLRAVLRAEPPFAPPAAQMEAVWDRLDPVYGRFPINRRLNMDQTAVFFYKPWGNGKTYVVPDEKTKGGYKNSHIRTGRPHRLATHIACVCADPSVKPPPPALVFQGAGGISAAFKNEMDTAAAAWGVQYTWQKKAWCDTSIMVWYFDKVVKPWVAEQLSPEEKTRPDRQFLLILDHNGKTHNSVACRRAIAKAGCLAFFGEANMTHRWQPFDSGIGYWGQRRLDNQLRKWQSKSTNRKAYYTRQLTVQNQRLMALQFVGKSFEDLHGGDNVHLLESAWSHTGADLTADGSRDGTVIPEGLKAYTVPPVGTEAMPLEDPRDLPYTSDMDDEGDVDADAESDEESSSSSSSSDDDSSSSGSSSSGP